MVPGDINRSGSHAADNTAAAAMLRTAQTAIRLLTHTPSAATESRGQVLEFRRPWEPTAKARAHMQRIGLKP